MSSAYSTYVGPPGVGPILLPVEPLTTEQYLRMIEAGILDSAKVELIGGQITPMAPAGPEHNSSLMQLTRLFAQIVDRYFLLVQGTVVITEGQVFDPDFALLRLKPGGYKRAHARPSDIALVVESAASSLTKDRHVKLPIYAAAGIQEYWIVDLERELLTAYRDPEEQRYNSSQSMSGDDKISPLACPELTIRVGDIFA